MTLKTGREYRQSIEALALDAHLMGQPASGLGDHALGP